jgi:hypothetical protein
MCARVIYAKNMVFIDGIKVGDGRIEICANQTIETKIDSAAIVQFSDYAVLTIKQNSKIRLLKAKNLDPHKIYVNLVQEYGATFSRVTPTKADYFLTTPHVVVAVRGTAFETVSTTDKTDVKVFKGKVLLRKKSNGELAVDEERFRFYLNKREKVTVTSKAFETPQPTTIEERERLKIMDQIHENQKDLSIAVTKNLPKDSSIMIVNPEKRGVINLTLDDVKRLHGEIAKIRTFDGYEYIGAYKKEGDKILIFTITKTFYVRTRDVEAITSFLK